MSKKNNVRFHRKKVGLTQAELAERTDTSQQRIQRLEAGVGPLHIEILHRIAGVLDVSLKDLVPSLKTAVTQTGRKGRKAVEEEPGPAIERDGAPRRTIAFWLSGGHEIIAEYFDNDHERIREVLWRGDSEWLLFDGPELAVAVRCKALESWRLMF